MNPRVDIDDVVVAGDKVTVYMSYSDGDGMRDFPAEMSRQEARKLIKLLQTKIGIDVISLNVRLETLSEHLAQVAAKEMDKRGLTMSANVDVMARVFAPLFERELRAVEAKQTIV